MDIRIKDNDIYTSSSGQTEYIFSSDELSQRVMIACSAKKGEYIYDRNLGSDISYIDLTSGDACEKLSLAFSEAVVDIPDICVNVSSVIRENGAYYANVTWRRGEDTSTVRVKLNG